MLDLTKLSSTLVAVPYFRKDDLTKTPYIAVEDHGFYQVFDTTAVKGGINKHHYADFMNSREFLEEFESRRISDFSHIEKEFIFVQLFNFYKKLNEEVLEALYNSHGEEFSKLLLAAQLTSDAMVSSGKALEKYSKHADLERAGWAWAGSDGTPPELTRGGYTR